MKTLISLFIVFFLFNYSNTKSQIIEDYSTSTNSYEIKDGIIYNLSTGKSIYKLVNNVIKDSKSGKSLYTVVNGVLKSSGTKKNLYIYENGKVSVYSSDTPLYEINDSGVIKSWSMGMGLYRINGSFGAGELFMVLLATGLL